MKSKNHGDPIKGSHGWLTAETARKITPRLEARDYQVLFDHGRRGEKNVGKIVCGFGNDSGREASLTHLDIAVIDQSSEKKYLL